MLHLFCRFMHIRIAHRAAQANILFAKTVSSNMEIVFTYASSFFVRWQKHHLIVPMFESLCQTPHLTPPQAKMDALR